MTQNFSGGVNLVPTADMQEPSGASSSLRDIRIYRFVSLLLSVLFAFVGLLFLLAPNSVIWTMNGLSRILSMRESLPLEFNFFLILAVAYMYLVALLAFLMFLHPGNTLFPWMLINAKGATAVISICLVLLHGVYIVYIMNGIVDGSIALGVFMLSRKMRKGAA